MDLLDKFDAVTILADARISQADKNYCETQQKAYEAAISSYKELAFFWEDMYSIHLLQAKICHQSYLKTIHIRLYIGSLLIG